jgi:predicted AlkP superfamily phosphohydrolase/phosphomutase
MDTIVIGLDGGEWDVIEPLIDEGELPTLARLRDEGVSGDLTSTRPPMSPPAWTSVHTGKNPGKHGIFDFNRYDKKYRQRTMNASDRRTPPFWRMMNDAGITTGLFKVPFTYPLGEIEGYAVSGFPTPSTVTDYTVPEELADELGSPENLFEDWSYIKDGEFEAFAENILTVAERQTELFLNLLDRYDTDFAMTVYDGSDRMQHFYWKFFDEKHSRYTEHDVLSDAIPAFYRTVDEGIGKILDAVDEGTDVLIFSDHGFGPLTTDIHADEWLADNGYLSRYDTESPADTPMLASRIIDAIWSTVERLDFDNALKRVLPEEVVITGGHLRNKQDRAIDWTQTIAFFTNTSGQAFHVNQEGRFSKGTVTDAEYEAIVNELRSALLDLRHPGSGDPLVREVYRTSDIYSGSAVDVAPDLIIESVPESTFVDGPADDLVTPATQHGQDRSGDHRRRGIFVASGPSFRSGNVSEISVMDVAPTLLYRHDCAVPKSMDGQVRTDLFDGDLGPVEHTDGYERSDIEDREWSDEEAEELETRLQDMGYME